MKAKLVPYQGGVNLFLANKNFAQQGFLTAEPLVAAKAGAKTRFFSLDSVGFNPYTTVVAVSRETLVNKREEVKKVVAGIRQGWEDYLANPTETDKVMNKLNPSMALDIFTEGGKAQLSLIKPTKDFKIGTMTAERWKTLSLQFKELGLIKKSQSPESYFENL
jgi:NitT/TauT family transport system substrate-binding protein